MSAGATQAIPAADYRLQQFIRQRPDQAPAFAVPAAEWGAPEARLATWLAPEAQAFGLGDLRNEVAEALRRANRFSEQLQHTVGQPALVKSSAGGRPLGRTRVSWTGDVRTAWHPGLGPVEAAVHEQALQLALATAHAWLRIITHCRPESGQRPGGSIRTGRRNPVG